MLTLNIVRNALKSNVKSLLRPSMSQGTVMLHNRLQEKDFTVATPEEFVKRFQGTKVINKASIFIFYLYFTLLPMLVFFLPFIFLENLLSLVTSF